MQNDRVYFNEKKVQKNLPRFRRCDNSEGIVPSIFQCAEGKVNKIMLTIDIHYEIIIV